MEHYFSKTPGHDASPVYSVAGTLWEMILKKNDSSVVNRAFGTLEWQLNNLDRLQHPKAAEVRNILEKYWYGWSDKQSFLWNIPTVRRELSAMGHDIREEIKSNVRKKVSAFLLPEDSPDTDTREAA